MLDGREALRQIDRAIDQARGEAETLKQSLADITEREVALRGGARQALEELARFRLDLAHAGAVSASIAGLDREVEELMQARAREAEELERRLAAAGEIIVALEQRRAEAATAAESAAEALDAAEQELQATLGRDTEYVTRHEATERAETVAVEAEHKHALAAEDRRVKGAPYEADPLFMYLWSRGFGTPDYRRSGLIRMADNWVARLIRYEGARRNYFTLTEIPVRLGEHVTRMRAAADAEIDALAGLEAAARENTEIPALERALGEEQASVTAIDAEIADAREQAREGEALKIAFEQGEDPKFRAAIKAMAAALDDDSIAELRRAARQTRMPEDDQIVERLVTLEDDLDELARDRDELKRHARSKSDRLIELEDMRVEFRRRKYDDYGSQFTDGGLFSMVLAEFIRGAISGSIYWDRLDRGHRRAPRRSKPDFGSGKFRFPGPLSFPGSRSGGGRSGGFRTGGGMSRGGGFRTGGGF